jgi:hypothetical protein
MDNTSSLRAHRLRRERSYDGFQMLTQSGGIGLIALPAALSDPVSDQGNGARRDARFCVSTAVILHTHLQADLNCPSQSLPRLRKVAVF